MLLESLIICSLILNAPYYDCSEKWTINIYDNDAYKHCYRVDGVACALWGTWAENGFREIPISLQTKNYGQWWTMAEYPKDKCGFGLLQHELNHLLYLDGNFCH